MRNMLKHEQLLGYDGSFTGTFLLPLPLPEDILNGLKDELKDAFGGVLAFSCTSTLIEYRAANAWSACLLLNRTLSDAVCQGLGLPLRTNLTKPMIGQLGARIERMDKTAVKAAVRRQMVKTYPADFATVGG